MEDRFGILFDRHWCTGCHSCEMACQMEHRFPIGQSGVKVFEVGPWQIEGDVWQYDYAIAFTDQCDLCSSRTAKQKPPSCVQHCQASCLVFGRLDELEKLFAAKPKQTIFV